MPRHNSPFAELMRAMGDDEDTHASSDLTDVQLVARLQEVCGRMAEPNRFERGQVIRHKWPSMATVKDAGKPHVFLGYLDEPIQPASRIVDPRDYYSNSATGLLDFTAIGLSDGKCTEFLLDSRDWEPHPDFPSAP